MPVAISQPSQNAKHFLIVPHVLWDHVESSVHLTYTLLTRSPDILVTLLIPSIHADSAASALHHYHLHLDPTRLHVVHTQVDDRARIVRSNSLEPNDEPDEGCMTAHRAEKLIEPTLKALTTAYERLLELQPLTDACSDCPMAAFDIAPSVALVDIALASMAIILLRQLNIAANIHVKLVCWAPLSAKREMEGLVRRRGGFAKSPDRWDGLVHLWPACLESDSLPPFKSTGTRVLHIPLQMEHSKSAATWFDPSTLAFLQHHTASRGDHSVVFISLDDPPFPIETLRTLLLALHHLQTPYLLALPPADQRALDQARTLLLTDPGLGHLLPSGTARTAVLAHPAMMALLTRGSSSTTVLSAIKHAVPLIFCPESSDQDQLAMTFSSEPYRVGMKLYQRRQGPKSLQKTTTGLNGEQTGGASREQFEQIVQDLSGHPGKALRKRIEAIRDEVRDEAESGRNRRALDLLLDF